MYRSKKIFLYKNKQKNYLFGVIMNLFLVVMTIIRCCMKKNYLGVLILLPARIGCEIKINFLISLNQEKLFTVEILYLLFFTYRMFIHFFKKQNRYP